MITCRIPVQGNALVLLVIVVVVVVEAHREALEEHLASCPDCGAFAETYESVIRLGRQMKPGALAPEFYEALGRNAGLPSAPLARRVEGVPANTAGG